jgi:hypothetical protein
VDILTLGRRFPGGEPLIAPMNEQVFAGSLLEGLGGRAGELEGLARATTTGSTFRGREVARRPEVDLGDPVAAGWTFLVAADDPHLEGVVGVIEPLAVRRGMSDVREPLRFAGEPQDEWFEWLLENHTSLDGARVPQYILIVGSPERVPFAFQAFLQTVASVGRVAFESLHELAAYVEKIARLEDAASAASVHNEAVFFAPDAGAGDPTFFSRRYMGVREPHEYASFVGKRLAGAFDPAAALHRVQRGLGDQVADPHLRSSLNSRSCGSASRLMVAASTRPQSGHALL